MVKRINIHGTGKAIWLDTNFDDPYFCTEAVLKSKNKRLDDYYSREPVSHDIGLAETILQWIQDA